MLFKIKNFLTPTIISIMALLLIVSGYLGALSVEKKSYEIPNLISESIRCSTQSPSNTTEFIVFITDKPIASKLLTTLCANPSVNKQFGHVVVHWNHNEQETSQYIGKGLANLALVKDNMMDPFATQRTNEYKAIARYQDYAAYMFSLKEKPRLTKEYLLGKRLGLLDYSSSRSGHIIPVKLLNSLGLNDDNMHITYVKSHSALRDLLSSGKVDLISSYWRKQDSERFSANYLTPIETKITGSKWYLKMTNENTDLLCDLQNSLKDLTQEINSQYYSELITLDFNCQNSTEPAQ